MHRHVITCGHGDSLEFKFTSPESDTLLYRVWVRKAPAMQIIICKHITQVGMIHYADTMSGYYDIAVASGDTFRAPYDS
jgi:hypothetical protein